MLKKFLEKLLRRQDLTAAETVEMLGVLFSGESSCFQAGAVLAALRMKGESVEELVGGAEMMRRYCQKIDCDGSNAIDIVGTGGDGGKSFNISTTAAIVAAGAGCVVAKHGNRAVSGQSGAADVLAALGFNLDVPPDMIESSIREHGIGFMFAQKMHPIMGKVAGMRRELGVRTIFNMLGPLANPASVTAMLVGVYDAALTELYAAALRELGVRRAMVVYGHDGLDEISCTESTRVTELRDGALSSYEIHPEILLGETYDLADLAGGDPDVNAAITRRVLSGEDRGAARAVVVINAAAACAVAGLAASLADGIPLAEDAIDSGRAMAKLQALVEASQP